MKKNFKGKTISKIVLALYGTSKIVDHGNASLT